MKDGRFSLGLTVLIRLGLGGIFLSSGLQKLAHLDLFYQTAQGYHFLTPNLTQLYAGWLPWLEILAGSLLLLGLFRRFSAILTSLLLLSFLVAIGWVLFRGDTVDCGCFLGGSQASPVTWELWIRDLFLLFAAAFLVWTKFFPWGLDGFLQQKKLLKKVGVGLVVIYLLITGVSAFNSQIPAPPSTAEIQPLLPVGTKAPDFSLPDLEGKIVRLKDFYNQKSVLIEVFATWCPHCQHSVPLLKKLQNVKTNKLQILAMNAGDPLDKPSTAPAFRQYFKVTYPILERPSMALMDLYHVSGFPTFYLIGKDGKIAWTHVGSLDEKTLRQLEAVLK